MKSLIIVFIVSLPIFLFAQIDSLLLKQQTKYNTTIMITGKVIDKISKEPLYGCWISRENIADTSFKGRYITTASNTGLTGEFRFEIEDLQHSTSQTITLQITHEGYDNVEVFLIGECIPLSLQIELTRNKKWEKQKSPEQIEPFRCN